MTTSRQQKRNFLYEYLYYIYVVIYLFLVVSFGMGTKESELRYYLLFVLVLMTLFSSLLIRDKKKAKEKKKTKTNFPFIFAIVAALFYVTSLVLCVKAGVEMPFRVYTQISLFLLPAIYGYTIVKILPKETILRMLKVTLGISVIFYFLESRHTIFEFLKIENYAKINLLHSKTFTESNNLSEQFLQLFLIFNYLDNDKDKNLKRCKVVSFIFTILAFKRLSVIFALITLLFGSVIKRNENKTVNALIPTIIVVVLTCLYAQLLKGEIDGMSYDQVFDLTSGRNWILSHWADEGYVSYGYGSSMLIINKYLELDLVQIQLELGIVCLVAFVYSFFRRSEKNLYVFLVTTYVMLNYLTASGLPVINGTIAYFIGIEIINQGKINKEEVKNERID